VNARRVVLASFALALVAACAAPAPLDVPDRVAPSATADAWRDALRCGDAATVVRLVAGSPEDSARALRIAAQWNHVAVARALLGAGVPAGVADANGETALHAARSDAMVALLLASGADARAVDGKGRAVTRVHGSPPRELARRVVRRLAAAGARVEPVTAVRFLDVDEVRASLAGGAADDPCLLHLAAARGDVAIVDVLLTAGAAREGPCPGSESFATWRDNALATAVQRGNYAVAAALLAAGMPVVGDGWQDTRHGKTDGGVLQRAAGDAPAAFVAQLLDAGAAIEGTGAGDTPLAHAAGRGRLDTVRLLLARGADPLRSSGGATPLRHGCAGGHADVADALVAAGAAMTLLDAVMLGRDADVRRLLAADPAARERPDERLRMRPLLWATALGRAEVAATLLAAGAHVNARSGWRPEPDVADAWWPRGGWHRVAADGVSALGRAVARCDWRIANQLAAAGARPVAEDAAALVACPAAEATALLRRLLDRRALHDGAMLAALAAAATAAVPFAVRDARSRLLLTSGAVPLLSRDDARGVLRDADPASMAPFANELLRHGWRPDLPTAARFGWHGYVRTLLASGDFGEHDVVQARLAACATDQPAVLRELRPSPPQWTVRETAQHAAFRGATAVLRDLLDQRELTLADCGSGGLDLLASAAGADGDHAAFVQALLGLGLDPDGARDGSPLLRACSEQNHAVIAALLAGGARAGACHDDRTPLWELLRNRCDRDTVVSIRRLLAAGADPVEGQFLARLESWHEWCRDPELRAELAALLAECGVPAR
jgi:ankyrin repeat protein